MTQTTTAEPCAESAGSQKPLFSRTPGWQRRSMRRYRSNARFVDANKHFKPLDRERLYKIMWLAEQLEYRTRAKLKRKGCRNGLLGAIGLEVLRALLFRFLNTKSGACMPSYVAIAKALSISETAVADALARLEACGLLTITRRLIRKAVACPVTGNTILATQQGTNLYSFGEPHRFVDIRPLPAGKTRAVIRSGAALMARIFKGMEADLPTSRENQTNRSSKPIGPRTLADVLADLGRNVAAKGRGSAVKGFAMEGACEHWQA
jgi:DNA-binding Lrp family transcriptional regulator